MAAEHRCHCPCSELRCSDPSTLDLVSEQEQVVFVAEIGLVAATIDEQIGPAKANALATAIRLLPGMSGLSESELNMLMAQAGVRSQEGKRWLCRTANGIRSPVLRRIAFRMAAMFSAWQGSLEPRAQEYLSAIATAFNLTDAQAAELFVQATGWELHVELDEVELASERG